MRRPRLPPWSWHGVVAAIIGLAVSAGWAASIVLVSASDFEQADAHLNMLSVIGGVLAGGVASYLGRTDRSVASHDGETADPTADG